MAKRIVATTNPATVVAAALCRRFSSARWLSVRELSFVVPLWNLLIYGFAAGGVGDGAAGAVEPVLEF